MKKSILLMGILTVISLVIVSVYFGCTTNSNRGVVNYGNNGNKIETYEDIIMHLGEPEAYLWGNDTFTKRDLPIRFIMKYKNDFYVFISDNWIIELRNEGNEELEDLNGLRIGQSVDEVFEIIGEPRFTEESIDSSWYEENTYYKRIENSTDENITGYYSNTEKNVRMFILNGKIISLYMTGGFSKEYLDYVKEIIGLKSKRSIFNNNQTNNRDNNFILEVPYISREPDLFNYRTRDIDILPEINNYNGIDLRNTDLSALDLSNEYSKLMLSTFDDKTEWPNTIPSNFDSSEIMDMGINPGLNIRSLHRRGIDGEGIGIAIIDQPLDVNHIEYKDNLLYYNELSNARSIQVEMHGPAVASIAVGENCGVAPEADLYYIASYAGIFGRNGFEYDFSYIANAIEYIIQINNSLPDDKKIRVISISVGWNNTQKGYDEIMEACRKAIEQNIFVISATNDDLYDINLDFYGLGRYPTENPDLYESYSDTAHSRNNSSMYSNNNETLLIPMDSRTVASPTGSNDYVYYRLGGLSWSIPYIAGLYALACQIDPSINYHQFWETAIDTSLTTNYIYDGKSYSLNNIINPVRLIEQIEADL